MPRITIIPEDNKIVVDQVSVTVPLPEHDPNWRALQYDLTDDLLRFELKQGSRDPVSGDEAAALIKPFVDAHTAEMARVQADEAAADPKVASESVPGTQHF